MTALRSCSHYSHRRKAELEPALLENCWLSNDAPGLKVRRNTGSQDYFMQIVEKPNETSLNENDLAQDARCVSGIEGFDEILSGGLPSDCFYLIQGDPGSGKTTLALQFLMEGLRRGEKVFYITLSETREELLQVADSHNWSLDGIALLELSAIEALLRPEAQTTVFHPSEMELNKVTNLLLDEARKGNTARVRFY